MTTTKTTISRPRPRPAFVSQMLSEFHDTVRHDAGHRARAEEALDHALAGLPWNLGGDGVPTDPAWVVVEGSLASRRYLILRILHNINEIHTGSDAS